MTDTLETLLLEYSLSPREYALIIEATIGLAVCQLLGQIVAFRKYIELKKPLRQSLVFTFAKIYSFLLNTIKSFGFVFLGYLALLSVQFIIHEDIVGSKPEWVQALYGILLILCFLLGFYRERKRTLLKNQVVNRPASGSRDSATDDPSPDDVGIPSSPSPESSTKL